MGKKQWKKLEKLGYRVGNNGDFLNLTPEEEAYIEIRLEISSLVKARRTQKGWTQEDLAEAMESSQSRVAKMEAGDPSTSLDLMIKALLKLGVSKQEIGKLLEGNLETA
ncbi:MAG: helix-turn-helix transcriptional regulator [Balneolaceae bacterium]|nr:helix-turn-helix transcriptional regulator [Balneolaceae bacterium]